MSVGWGAALPEGGQGGRQVAMSVGWGVALPEGGGSGPIREWHKHHPCVQWEGAPTCSVSGQWLGLR